MPTENERKFALHCNDPDQELNILKGEYGYSIISQGYLVRDKHLTCRVRHLERDTYTTFGSNEWSLTVKRDIGSRVIEIETSIDKRDFDDLWAVSKGKLSKTRVYIDDWEVDFFLDDQCKVYFVLAECEMPEGKEYPDELIPFVKDHLLYEVPRGDARFSNRKLGKVKYASKLLSLITKERLQCTNC